MSFQYDISRQEPSLSEEEESQFWAEQLARYLRPYQERLDAYVDRRVVGNLMATVGAIVQSRCALTTSELGSAICGPAHAEAGTQRLQYALHHQGWEAEVIEEVWWKNRKVSNCKAWGRCAPAKCDAWHAAAKASTINLVASR